MEKLTNAYKSELLNALSDLEINDYDFEHQIEDCNITYAKCYKQMETKNLNIGVTLEATAEWEAYDYFETTNIELSDIEVICENGHIDISLSMKTELENNLNY